MKRYIPVLPAGLQVRTGEFVPSGPDLEDGLAGTEQSGVIADRRRLAAGRVAHQGGAGAWDVNAGRGVRRDLHPVGELAAAALPAGPDRSARRLLAAARAVQRSPGMRAQQQPAEAGRAGCLVDP